MQDLLSFVQNYARSKRENLAGEVLALLLREEPGQAVIRQIISGSSAAEAPIEVITQRVVEGCVPDIHLVQQGRTIGLLELKFWARFTGHQLSGRYLDVAPSVVFVVPKERIAAVQQELSELGSRRPLIVESWEDLLSRLASAAGGGDSHDERLFAGALDHLKEFCNVIEQKHFLPFTTEQLHTPTQDIATQHLVWLTREVIASATRAEIISEAGRLGAGFDSFFFYGQTVLLGGISAWLGYWPHAWRQAPTAGPLWVQFEGSHATTLMRSGSFGDGMRTIGNNDLAFPLFNAANESASSQEDEVQAIIEALAHLRGRVTKHSDQASPTI